VPLTVQFSSAGSSDPDGSIVEYYWTFGDAFGTHSYEANPTYLYDYAGTYTATLTVTDNNNLSRSDTVTVTVNTPPTTVLRSTAINLTAKVTGSRVTVNGTVAIKNGAGTAVRGASVTVTWTKPDLSAATQTATTDTSGNARFSTTGGRGTFTLIVNNVTKSGYTFDPGGSILSKSITLLPTLRLSRAGQNVVLAWPTNDSGFTLQSAAALSAAPTWSTVPQAPVVNGTNFTVTVPLAGGNSLYRLIQP